MTRLSIRWRLTLWYAAALSVVLGIFCLVLLLLTRHQLQARMDTSLREELTELALEVNLAHDAAELQRQLKSRFFRHTDYEFLIVDASGQPVFASSRIEPARFAGLAATTSDGLRFENLSVEGLGRQRIASTSVAGPAGRLTVHAVAPLAPLQNDITTILTVMLLLLPLGCAASSVGGYFLAGRALAPVQQIVDVANGMTISSLYRRIEVVNPHDEIGGLAMTLNALIDRIERAVDEIRRFTADASHEIRTPLAALRLEAESALRAPRLAEDYRRTLAVVVEEATRLGRLADELLNLSRDDAGIGFCERDSVQMDALLHDVVEQLRLLAKQRNVELVIESVASCHMLGDDVRLSQTFFNIVENGIKYTSSGGRVAIRSRVVDGVGEFEFEDTGCGIPAEHLPRIFDRFYRVDSSRTLQSGGSGLGLAIVRSAVLAHAGTVDVRSRVGHGTVVMVRLPGVVPVGFRETAESVEASA